MTRLARALVGLAVRALPRSARRRYAAELDAELLDLPRRRRLGYALSVLGGSPRLRWELLVALCRPHSPAPCWLGLHRDRTVHPNREEHWVVAKECRRCHRVRDPRQYLPARRRLDGVAWAASTAGTR